jgi:hypothetical protein
MRGTLAAALAASLTLSTLASAAPLAPGKPAGVRSAQYYEDETPLILVGVAALAVGIALAASDHHHDGRFPGGDGHGDGSSSGSSTGTH